MAFDTQFSRVSMPDGTFSTVFTMLMLSIGWTIYLHYRSFANEFQASVLSAQWVFRPDWFMDIARIGGPFTTLACALLLMIHVTAVVFVSGVLIYGVVRLFDGLSEGRITVRPRFPFITTTASPREERRINSGHTPTGHDLVTVPPRGSRLVIETAEHQVFTNVFPEYYLRMQSIVPKVLRAPETPVEKLELAIMAMLNAHPSWPADPTGHHADTSLLAHSLKVRDDVSARLPDEPLASVLGLSHDIGKLIAYHLRKTPDGQERWAKRTQQVDRLSAQVMRLTPEFWKLDPADRQTLNVVLTYAHSPDTMPRGSTTPRDRQLLEAIRISDGVNTRNEQTAAVHVADRVDVVDKIRERLDDIFANLNINQALDPAAHADGWAQPVNGFLLVVASRFRENLKGLLDAESERALALRSNEVQGRRHPALYAIHKALESESLLITSWKGFSPDLSIYDAKVGRINFAGLFAIDLGAMRERLPDVVENWGRSEYAIRIKTAAARREGTAG